MSLAGLDVTFLPADPPRHGRFAFFGSGLAARDLEAPQAGGEIRSGGGLLGSAGEIVLVLPAGRRVRRVRAPALLVSIAETLDHLLDPGAEPVTESAASWSSVLVATLGMIARGRLRPAVTTAGLDAWRLGTLTRDDQILLTELARRLPPLAHAVAIPDSSPLRVASAETLVRAAADAVCDALVRTAGASPCHGVSAFAASEAVDVSGLRPWLSEAVGAFEGGASVGLRVELDGDGDARAVVQLTSANDPSLVVDAADLFSMPAAVLARFGHEAERDLLLALRRGARVFDPISDLLAQAVPEVVLLDDDHLAQLVEHGLDDLAAAGIAVLWPAEMLKTSVSLRAVATPAPGSLVSSGLDLASLLDVRLELVLGDEALTAEELDVLSRARRGVVRLRGKFVRVDSALLERVASARSRRIAAIEALAGVLSGRLDVDGEAVEFRATAPVEDLAERLRAVSSGGLVELDHPDGLQAELRPYQHRGVAWLSQMCALGLGGCLADDMGLGKTVQVIALHVHRSQTDRSPALVICPTSLLGNWEREIRRFAPGMAVRRFHGGERHLDELAPGEVVLTSYGVLRRERERLGGAGFSLVVADEAQQAKNPLSETAHALRAIPASARVALTGTPVENRLSELWSILDWTTPGLLGPLERFRRSVAVPIERHRDPQATARLASAVRPFLLRRRKTDPGVAPDLPERTVTDVVVPLGAEQARLYQAEVDETLEAIEGTSGIGRQGLVLKLLTALKQVCNHPAQYLHESGPLAGRSGKLAALEELVEVIVSEGDSILVFSQFVEMCTLVEARLAELGQPTVFLHGGVGARRRDELVQAFQAGEVPIFLLSLKAGGVGLNLTRATHVIHYDRWWNPAVEDQASDRAHRIGQTRAVQIHRLMCEGTLEDKIGQVLERKRALAESVVGGGESWIGDLSDEELGELVQLGTGEGRS